MTVQVRYECKRCGDMGLIIKSTKPEDLVLVENGALPGIPTEHTPENWTRFFMNHPGNATPLIHNCDDGGAGVYEFIGMDNVTIESLEK